MNIYCIIFMCTFGANNTDTEMPSNNSLIEGPTSSNITSMRDMGNGTATTPVDVASMILPERGEPVPQAADIVMELPNLHHQDNTPTAPMSSSSSNLQDNESIAVTAPDSAARSPTLSEILLPPSLQIRNQVDSK